MRGKLWPRTCSSTLELRPQNLTCGIGVLELDGFFASSRSLLRIFREGKDGGS